MKAVVAERRSSHLEWMSPLVRRRLRRFVRNWLGMVGAIVLLAILVMAAFPSIVAPYGPYAQSLTNIFKPPSAQHLLGTDELGRDVLSRVIYGARTSVTAAIVVTAIAIGGGVPFGMSAAYWPRLGRVLDIMNDALMSVPALLLAIAIVAVMGRGIVSSMLGIGIAFIPRFYRLTRASTRRLMQETFIEAAHATGCSAMRTLRRHILPNILTPVLVQGAFTFGTAIVAEAGLSFLGLGVPPPTPSWGDMLQSAVQTLYQGSYIIWGPGVMITLTVLASQFVADGLQDALDTSVRDFGVRA